MKKLILTVTASLACLAAFAQGKLQFSTDSAHLVYFDPARTAAGDSALAGRGLYGTTMSQISGGAVLVADLYAGTSSTALSLVSTTTFSASVSEGRWTAQNITFASIPGNTTAFLQVQIRDTRDATAAASAAAGHYSGLSQIFSAVAQPSSPNPMYQSTAPVSSTWAAGTFNMDSVSAGFKGAIPIGVVPEPATAGLLGLGLAAMAIFRRRK